MKAEHIWVGLLLSSLSSNTLATDDNACRKYMIYKEARGESVRTMRAVLDVLENRMARRSLSVCEVLKEPGQYPYMRKGGVKKVVDKQFLRKYYSAYAMEPVLSSRYMFFNHTKFSWGKNTKRVGRLYFSQ